jgi:hypothetical protein
VEAPRPAATSSQIAQERIQPGPAGPLFLAAAAASGLATFAVAAVLGIHPSQPTGAELLSPTPGLLGTHAARLLSATAAGATVIAICFFARQLLHSDAFGLLAGAFVALDPGFLAMARLGTLDTVALAALAGSLALYFGSHSWQHWLAGATLGAAVAIDPRALLWGIPFSLVALLRGHIYASPRHLGVAVSQAVALPAVGLVVGVGLTQGELTLLPCTGDPLRRLLLLNSSDYGDGILALHDPVLWLGGAFALLFLAGAGLYVIGRQFRIARLPGRVQLRLSNPLPPNHARVLWLVPFALVFPFPSAWLLVFAVALAAGVAFLAEDAPGFGGTVAIVLLAFAIIAVFRVWPLLAGGAEAGRVDDLMGLVPWTQAEPCP